MNMQKELKISFRGNIVTSKLIFYFISSWSLIFHKVIKNKILQNSKKDRITPSLLARRKGKEVEPSVMVASLL